MEKQEIRHTASLFIYSAGIENAVRTAEKHHVISFTYSYEYNRFDALFGSMRDALAFRSEYETIYAWENEVRVKAA